MVSVCRTKSDLTTSSLESTYYTNSKFFIRFVNIFALNGGFEIMKATLAHQTVLCAPVFVGYFMNILSNTAPYLLNRFVLSTGREFAELSLMYVLEAPADNLRILSKEVVENIYKGIEQLTKRIFSQEESRNMTESFMLRVAMIFVGTDNLERKIHGVSILGDIVKKIKGKKFDMIGKKDLTEMIDKGSILLT